MRAHLVAAEVAISSSHLMHACNTADQIPLIFRMYDSCSQKDIFAVSCCFGLTLKLLSGANGGVR